MTSRPKVGAKKVATVAAPVATAPVAATPAAPVAVANSDNAPKLVSRAQRPRDEWLFDESGRCAKIYVHKVGEEEFALKRYVIPEHGGIPEYILREMILLSTLQHPFVWQCVRLERVENVVDIVMKLAIGDLRKVFRWFEENELDEVPEMDQEHPQSETDKLMASKVYRPLVVWRILHAVDYLHRHRLMHIDIKAENVFVIGDSYDACLADLGLTLPLLEAEHTYWPEEYEFGRITEELAPPRKKERIHYYTPKCDEYMVGRLLVDLFTSRDTFPLHSKTVELEDSKHPAWAELGIWAPIAKRLLESDETKRSTAAEILALPFWSDLAKTFPAEARNVFTVPVEKPDLLPPVEPKPVLPALVNVVEECCVIYNTQVITLFHAQEILCRLPKPSPAQAIAAFWMMSKYYEFDAPSLPTVCTQMVAQYPQLNKTVTELEILVRDAEWVIIMALYGRLLPPTLYYGTKDEILSQYDHFSSADGYTVPRKPAVVDSMWRVNQFFTK